MLTPYLLQVPAKPLLQVQGSHHKHQVQDYCHKTQDWSWSQGLLMLEQVSVLVILQVVRERERTSWPPHQVLVAQVRVKGYCH